MLARRVKTKTKKSYCAQFALDETHGPFLDLSSGAGGLLSCLERLSLQDCERALDCSNSCLAAWRIKKTSSEPVIETVDVRSMLTDYLLKPKDCASSSVLSVGLNLMAKVMFVSRIAAQ